MNCRVLSYRIDHGPANMAIDEAMLECVANDPSTAWFRTYGWAEPTLSLGYFQRWEDSETEARWRSAPRVRRSTGGGAIWHEHELTFAVVIPSTHRLARPNTALYRAIHDAVAGLLTERGLATNRNGETDAAPGPFLCFAGRDGEDLVSGGVKLLGSAQRRRAGAVLQHSSLLLRRAGAVPELPGAADLADVSDDPLSWSRIVADRLVPTLGLEPIAADWSDEFLDRARRIEREVYGNPAWNHKR